MLARDYGCVGSNDSSVLASWSTEGYMGRLGNIGSGRDGATTISDALGNVQICGSEGKPSGPGLGRKGRSLGEVVQPCQTALSADGTVLAIADSGNNRVQLFDAITSKFLASVGRRGQIRPGRMQGPEGVAFVDGRREMIVADTGNNRLQIFHVDELAVPRDDPGTQRDVPSSSSSSSVSGIPSMDGTVGSWQTAPPSSEMPSSWERSQAPPPKPPPRQDEKRRPHQSGRGTGEPQREASNFEQGLDDADGDDNACLLVFAGGEDAGGLRQRRVAGESEDAEGPLSQPCDVAYWRPRRTAGKNPEKEGRKKNKKRKQEGKEGEQEDTTAVWAWNPEPPRWFWPNPEDEERARRDLFSPVSPPRTNPAPNSKPPAEFPLRGHTEKPIDLRSTTGGESSTEQLRDSSIKGGGTGEPTLGAFVVCATGLAGKLQLSFVAKTKEAEEAEHAAANGSESAESEDESVSSFSGRRSIEEQGEDDSSEGFDWMSRPTTSLADAQSGRRGPGRRGGGEYGERKQNKGGVAGGTRGERDDTSSQASSSTPVPTSEIKEEVITVREGGESVEICGRVYDSLLSLLRAFRGRGFARLVGVDDARGDRGIVAVAERGGGRVRLLHYAPALRPFYPTEITHLHSIEGLRRPSSVSFSPDGDLLVVDQGARKVLVYSHLSGRWLLVREFGPGLAGVGHGCENGEETAKENKLSACDLQSGERKDRENATTSTQNQHEESGLAEEEGGAADGGTIDWGTGTPVSARFARLENVGRGSGKIPVSDDECPHAGLVTTTSIVVGTSDGIVRFLSGPQTRHCGRFVSLSEDGVLSILELLGYRSSQVLGHVNHTMADLRSKLRREWRLHPLTPGHLAKRTLEFLQWGRLMTGEGLPGRGKAVDAHGNQLCDRFLATSACSRPACPYSHHQPWIDPRSKNNADACIVFRGGVTHAVNNLYGQIFGWEWEGELYRLFRERSLLRTIVTRRDPMTLGIHGAEVVRDCVDTKDHVLDYDGFVDFATVVHEHVTGLRSWHRRPLPASDGGISDGDDATSATPLADDGPSARGLWSGGRQQQTHRDEDSGVCRTRNTTGQEAAVAVKSPAAEIKVEAEEKRDSPYSDDQVRMGRPNATTPWLGWDFAGMEDKVQAPDANTSGDAPPPQNNNPARSSSGREHARDDEAATTRRRGGGGDHDGEYHIDNKRETNEKETDEKEDQERYDEAKGQEGGHDEGSREEPKINREYGSTEGQQEASVNKIIAFQSDRVVRMLEDMFQ